MNLDSSITPANILDRAQSLSDNMRSWRQAIHRRPELGFQEYQTAALVNSVLTSLGIEATPGIAKTGVIGQIFAGSGPTVALRADMDALPIQETIDSEFISQTPGVMHACGHDAHTAMLLGAASIIKDLADEGLLPGNVRLIFQPSEEWQDEEGKSGGMRMVEEGAMESVDAIFGLHVDPSKPVGMVGTRSGPMMAAADTFKLVLIGSGGHAARPHEAVDVIALAGLLINAIHQLVSRRLNPLEPGVITIGTIHAGTVDNIIPDVLKMSGTLRSFSTDTRQLLIDELRKTCAMVETLGGQIKLDIIPGYPPSINNPVATQVMKKACVSIVGEEKFFETPMYMGAEDFSFFAQVAPACFLSLGVHDPAWGDDFCQLHQPTTRLSEEALPIGAAILVETMLDWMRQSK